MRGQTRAITTAHSSITPSTSQRACKSVPRTLPTAPARAVSTQRSRRA